jgi:hypothetical protein
MKRHLPIGATLPTALAVAVALTVGATALARPHVETRDAQADAWNAVAASGPVENRAADDGTWLAVRRGDALEPLSVLRTGKRGRATLARQASVILVDPDSSLQLPTADPVDGAYRVRQKTGTVIYEVERRDGRQFEVVTPYLVAGVKGTVFGITVADGYTMLSVEEGIVEVRSPGGDVMDVHAGEAVRVDAERGDVDLLRRERADRPQAGQRAPRLRENAQKEHRKLAELTARLDREDAERRFGDDLLRNDDPTLSKETGLFDEDPVASLDDEKEDPGTALDDKDDDLFDTRDDEIQKGKETERTTSPNNTSGSGGNN